MAIGNGTNCRMDRRTHRPGFNREMLFCIDKSLSFINFINVYFGSK